MTERKILSEVYWTQAMIWVLAAGLAAVAGKDNLVGMFGALAGIRAYRSLRAVLK